MDISNVSEPDIIDKTPEKETIKKSFKKSSISKNCHSTEGYIITPSFGLVSDQHINETKIFSAHYNKPYVYYSNDEILELSKNYVPKYNNILLVGKYLVHNIKGHCLINDKDMKSSCKIKLDFKLVMAIPDPNTCLSLYGSLEYEDLRYSRGPLFMVRFYRYESEGLLNKYKEYLKFAKKFLPSCYLELISIR